MIIGVGPFIGDFEQEITNFYPYARWISEVLDYEDIYINTHFNRLFLYDFIKESNKIPIYKSITRNELLLKGYVSKDIDIRNYNFLLTYFKNCIYTITSKSKSKIHIEYINYTKKVKPITIYSKIFEPIKFKPIEIPEEHKNRIIVIPHKKENIKRMESLINLLEDPIIIGDLSINFQDLNVILENKDYFENVYKYILTYLYYAKFVITPCSFWTLLCNIQKIPVVSWGLNIGSYKEDGIYNLDNKNAFIFYANKKTKAEDILNMFNYFKEKVVI